MNDDFKKSLNTYKENLKRLKDNLIKIVENTSDTKELNSKFMILASKEPENMDLFQTLMLMQDVSHTSHKNFKSSMIEAINIIINTKMDSYIQIEELHQRVSTIENNIGKQWKFPIIGKVPIKDVSIFLFMIFTFLVISYIQEPQATEKALDKVINETKKKAGF